MSGAIRAGDAADPHPHRRHLPSAEQELMLSAAIGDRGEAVEAWRDWRASIELDTIGGAETRLIPLAFRNLSRLGAIEADPEAGRLRGIYRRSWVRNQLQMQAAAGLIGRLGAAGVETIALKGAAMNCLYYADRGVRTMNDIDLLVRPDHVEAAGAALSQLGFRRPGADLGRALERKHALDFQNPDGLDLDLHWYSLMICGGDQDFWEASVEIELAGEPARALCPADQLLHTLVHGACDSHSFIWVCDAREVLTSGAVDWQRFEATAGRRHLTVIAVAMLRYLAERGWAPVPAEPLERLAAVEVAAWEANGFRTLTSPSGLMRTIRIAQERRRRMSESLPAERVPGPYAAIDGLYDYRPPGRLLIDGTRGVARRLRDRTA